MPQNILIGIGGTGARVIESMVHLCAAGFGPDELSMFLIDPDESNGNLTRTKTLITLYNQCVNKFESTPQTKKELFKTKIKIPDPLVWNIFKDKNNTLANYIKQTTLKGELSDLASVLFSKAELTTNLNEGFRGHPSIGAVVMSNPPEEEEPWAMLWDDIVDKKQNDVRVFLAGSVFGGTGAAGVPTFGANDIIKYNPKAKLGAGKSRILLGGALVLPYFGIERKDEVNEKMFVTNNDFPIATKAALHYYSEKELGFDQLYFIGDSLNQKVGEFHTGSVHQENKPHYIELVAALSANDFFAQDNIDGEPEKQYYIACRDDDTIHWRSLPVTRAESNILKKQVELKKSLITLVTYGYAFCSFGRDVLKEKHDEIDHTWYRENFKFNEKKEKDRIKNPRWHENLAQLDDMHKYLSNYFLPWICLIDDGNKVSLFNRSKICEGDVQISKPLRLVNYNTKGDNFGSFLKEDSEGKDFNHFLNNFLINISLKNEKTMNAANKYINIFYEAAQKFCAINYNLE